MVYGTDGEVMDFAYGGQKSNTPGIVPTARNTATTLINQYLNLQKDIAVPPTSVHNACNLIASELVKNPRTPIKDLLETIEILLSTLKDDIATSTDTRWGNIRYVSRE